MRGTFEKPLSKILYERDDGTVTIYVKIRDRSVFYEVYEEGNLEIDPLKYVEKDSDETLEAQKLRCKTIGHIINTLINQLSELLTSLELVERSEELRDELFKRDVKNILSYVTPYVSNVNNVTKYFLRST